MLGRAPLKELDSYMALLCKSTSEHAFTGRAPFEVDMRDTVELASIALGDVVQIQPDVLHAWHNSWVSANGAVERVCADQRNDEFRTDLLIAGPAADASSDPPVYPALAFTHSLEFTGKHMLTGIRVGLGFVDIDGQTLPDRWLEFSLPPANLSSKGYLARPLLGPPQHTAKLRGAVLLAERAALVGMAAEDPLKGSITISKHKKGAELYRRLMADPAAELEWSRSSRATDEQHNVVEVCMPFVDAQRFGPGRFIVLVRNSRHPDGDVLIFTDDEWSAFVARRMANLTLTSPN